MKKKVGIIISYAFIVAGCEMPSDNQSVSSQQSSADAAQEIHASPDLVTIFKSGGESVEVGETSQYSHHSIDFSNFTIMGKPTKIIMSPRRSFETYDPSQDEHVRSRFKAYMESGYPVLSPLRQDLMKINEIIAQEYRENYCSIITDGNCVTRNFKGCEGPPPYECISLPPGQVLRLECSFDDYHHDTREYKTMSNLDDAMSNYFKFKCHEWKE